MAVNPLGNMYGSRHPLVSSMHQNYKYTLPSHIEEYKQQLQNFKKMQGRVLSSLGGSILLNSN